MELKGTLKKINQVVNVSDKFKKREFVVTTTEDKFPQDILLQLSQDNVDLVDEFVLGDEVNVGFNLRGREWVNPKTGEVRYFNTLEAWRVSKVTKVKAEVPVAKPSGIVQNFQENMIDDMSNDDLPF